MNLLFAKDRTVGSDIVKGYLDGWEWSRDGGNYWNKRDFLSVHWEIHDESPYRVKLHVESPEFQSELQLNNLKNRIIIAILAKTAEISKSLKLGEIEIGSRLLHTNKNRSTEVFHIDIHVDKAGTDSEDNIRLVHEEIGNIIDQQVQKLRADIELHGMTAVQI